jgi:RNA-directed DNA polymerase
MHQQFFEESTNPKLDRGGYQVSYEAIISLENLLQAWNEFRRGKRKKLDVQKFERELADNILTLHEDLKNQTYRHGGYHHFKISDPKPRDIHKASVRDRLVHHAIYRILYPFFDRTFIYDSYSCRSGKGTHKAINRFRSFGYQVSQNHTRTAWVLKCDIKKFFASIDHQTLLQLVCGHIARQHVILNVIDREQITPLCYSIADSRNTWLLGKVISSFSTPGKAGVGLPLGNLTSQLFVNIYMNEFDQFVEHRLKVRHYIRYADDFVILSRNREWLYNLVSQIQDFLRNHLCLELHPNKVFMKTIASGVDFLGWVHFPDHRVLRTTTKRRMIRRIQEAKKSATIQSYFGLLKHGNTRKLLGAILKF